MAVAKLTKTKRAIQFVYEEGNVFFTSVVYMTGLLNGRAKGDFVLLKRLPQKVATNRFAESPLYDPQGLYEGEAAKTLTSQNDGLSDKARTDNSEKQAFKDKPVW